MASHQLTHAMFWNRMDRATRHVGKMPDWVKGSPHNERPPLTGRGQLQDRAGGASDSTVAPRQDTLPPRG
jgi:hypothetical protein